MAAKAKQNRNIIVFIVIAAMLFIAFLWGVGAFNTKPANTMNVYYVAVVKYTDGTQNTFTMNPSSSPPLTIVDPNNGNKAISSVQFDMYATAVFVGTVTTWSVAGSIQYYILPPATPTSIVPNANLASALWSSSARSIAPSGTTISSGTSFKVMSFVMLASDLSADYTNYVAGTNYFWLINFVSSTVSMYLTFSDGSTATQSATISTFPCWRFQYMASNTFTSLSVSFVQSIT